MKYLILIVINIFSFLLLAQDRSFIAVNATGPLSTGSLALSSPAFFDKKNDCLKINSGVSLFSGSIGSGLFVMLCDTEEDIRAVQFRLYPNPASSTSTLVSSILLRGEREISITIVDAMGRVVIQSFRSADQLLAGTSISLNSLVAGNYFLRIDGQVVHQVISFIKVN